MATICLTDSPEFAHLVAEWHPTLNTDLTPENTATGSGRTVWWICSKDDRHVWDAMPMARTRQNQGCPFCSGKRVLKGYNDLATVNPELAAQWHPTLNTEFTQYGIQASSNKKAFWICPVSDKHVWDASINSRNKGNGCPYCGNRKVLAGYNDLGSSKEHEYLISEWHPAKNDNLSPADYMVSSNTKVWWMCVEGHEWHASIANRTTKGSGCPECYKNNKINNPRQKVSSHKIAKEWHPDNEKTADDVTLGSGHSALWQCLKNSSHVWTAIVVDRTRGGGCTVCSGKTIIQGVNDLASLPEFSFLVEQWHPDNALTPSEVGFGTDVQVKWICPINDNHIWVVNLYSRTQQGTGCPECVGRSAWQEVKRTVADYPDLVAQWHASNMSKPNELSFRSKKEVTWVCSKNAKHVWSAAPYTRKLDGSDCPVCAGRVVIAGVNDAASHPLFKHVLKEFHSDNAFSLTDVSIGSNRMAKWQCRENDKHVWETPVYSRYRADDARGCPRCALALRVSAGEMELHAVLTLLGFEADQSRRDLIGGLELDLYISEKKFAIEFNGVYWHSDAVRPDPEYHAKKAELARRAGIYLYNVWSDDWKYRRDTVIRDLARRLDVTHMLPNVLPDDPAYWSETLHARHTSAVSVSAVEADDFLQTHDVLGVSSGEHYVGLRDHDGRLRAVMVLNHDGVKSSFRIDRFAVAGQVTVGFARLLKFVVKNFGATRLTVLDDLAFSSASLYTENGFIADGAIAPDYSYLVREVREPKTDYRLARFQRDKALVYQDGLSERELADLNGISRVWDFGKIRFVKALNREMVK